MKRSPPKHIIAKLLNMKERYIEIWEKSVKKNIFKILRKIIVYLELYNLQNKVSRAIAKNRNIWTNKTELLKGMRIFQEEEKFFQSKAMILKKVDK